MQEGDALENGGHCLHAVGLKGLVSIIREGEGFEERRTVGPDRGGGFHRRGAVEKHNAALFIILQSAMSEQFKTNVWLCVSSISNEMKCGIRWQKHLKDSWLQHGGWRRTDPTWWQYADIHAAELPQFIQ